MQTNPVTLPAFGSIIPGQGGAFVAILRGPTVDGVQQPPLALIKADAAHEIEAQWSEEYKSLDGCDSRTDGHANTLAMLEAGCPAAKHVRALVVDGHNDFFLPAIGQLNCAAANAPELFDPKGVYWASTQVSSYLAFVQDFEFGMSDWDGEGYEFRVCPVRVIQLELLSA